MDQTIHISDAFQTDKKGFLIPKGAGTPIAIDGIMTIGRDPSNDIIVNDPHVSLQHCQIEKRPQGFFIRDLRSRNGLLVNGIRVGEAQLLNGAQIQVGETSFNFETEAPCAEDQDLPLRSKNMFWRAKLQNVKNAAATDLPIFLQGESGVGKEVLASLIHKKSLRAGGPFVGVNCSALTESLVESELFGHVKGSFTGATGDRKGAFEAARGGTLFLDEIGDLPLSLQPKLLRALENNEIKPVGSDRIVATDVRVVVATHKNIEQMVKDGAFRADLYFRIHVVRIQIPSLRERIEDFEDLLYHFSKEMRVGFTQGAIERLKIHSWPGNIRELRNVVARARALYPNSYIQPEQVGNLIDQSPITAETYAPLRRTRPSKLREYEKEIIVERLKANGGNQRRTAADLGLPKSTLHDRLKTFGITVAEVLKPS